MSSTWTACSHNPAATQAIGVAIGQAARAGDLLALVGELGAGKTHLVRGIAAGIGIDPHLVASPTFVLIHEYESTAHDLPVLVHIDAYRLRGPAELESIGWHHDTAGAELRHGAVVVVEWADRVQQGLGDDYLLVRLEHRGDDRREVTLRAGPSWQDRLDALVSRLRTISGVSDGTVPHG